VNGDLSSEVSDAIQKLGLSLLGVIPSDPMVVELDARGRPMVELPSGSPVRQAVHGLALQLGLVQEPVAG
jgi:CO dehydrogenase maturation factor